ncbi:DUF1963 domain-containing protein [Tropicibacter naphthalenivorans]|uniref:DUF1963 domain-containing protein n=1 Tax=Tropicibacter naphthalenivorans TaxID=441103 RepID=A0A0P1G3G5_9RHOB|nr:YwqG family protein [Tropicibacter naphthalenivorans]CUH76245.1 hypothetical protein TRN7648_00852 [Tropicibacter naphthalenivorans]SMC39189.1 Uncharacterized protein YwqG [Tropicibacter naphthalenivorans]
MQIFLFLVAGIFAVALGQILLSLGIPAWVLVVVTTLILIFFRRTMVAIILGLRALADRVPALAPVLRAVAKWLEDEEHMAQEVQKADHLAEHRAAAARRQAAKDAAGAKKRAEHAKAKASAEQVFAKRSEPTIFLVPEAPGHQTSRSHIGGLPRLPEGEDWPKLDEALTFIAGIDMSEMPPEALSLDLPNEGWLYFFNNIHDDGMTGVVMYVPEPDERDSEPPESLPDLQDRFKTQRNPGVIKRTPVRAAAGRTMGDVYGDPNIPEPRFNEYYDVMMDAMNAAFDAVEDTPGALIRRRNMGAMVGGPEIPEANMEGGQGIQLLRLDTDDHMGITYGDCGAISFWIDHEDAARGNWDQAYMVVGSC